MIALMSQILGYHILAQILGMPHSSSSKIHAPLEVAKGYHVGYIEAKIRLNWSKPQNPV